jgi:AcrR family transcriptional regulator
VPAIAKTSDISVVRAAQRIVERRGVDELSMQAVASAVKVTAPALYKRFAGRDDLLRAVQRRGFAELAAALRSVAGHKDPAALLAAFASAYRAFAKERRSLYEAMFRDAGALGEEDLAARRAAAAPLLEALAGVVPAGEALKAARTLTAFAHGFAEMERAEAFRLGASVDEAFFYGVTTLVHAIIEGK